MRVGLFSDAHPDWATLGRSRFTEVECLVHHAVDAFIERECDVVCYTGDLCNPDRGPIVLRCVGLAVEAACKLARSKIPSIWIAGNHDVVEDGSGTTSLTPLRPLEWSTGLVHVSEQPETINVDGVMFHTFPFTATSHAYDPLHALDAIMSEEGETHVVLSHLHLEGIQPGEETKEMARGREVILPVKQIRERLPGVRIFSGHYHRAQDFDGVHVVGSLARLTKGEEDHVPTFSIVEIP